MKAEDLITRLNVGKLINAFADNFFDKKMAVVDAKALVDTQSQPDRMTNLIRVKVEFLIDPLSLNKNDD